MDELARRFADFAERYGPHAIGAARAATRMGAYSDLVYSVFSAFVAVLMMWLGRWIWRRDAGDDFDQGLLTFLGCVIVAVGGLVLVLAIWTWLDPWTWTAIRDPDLQIARKVLKL